MAASPLALPPLACGGLTERWPKGPAGRGSSLLATLTRLWMLALYSSIFPQQEENRGATVRAPKLLLAWAAAKAAWTGMRFDF